MSQKGWNPSQKLLTVDLSVAPVPLIVSCEKQFSIGRNPRLSLASNVDPTIAFSPSAAVVHTPAAVAV